jgi:hypothetical protein
VLTPGRAALATVADLPELLAHADRGSDEAARAVRRLCSSVLFGRPDDLADVAVRRLVSVLYGGHRPEQDQGGSHLDGRAECELLARARAMRRELAGDRPSAEMAALAASVTVSWVAYTVLEWLAATEAPAADAKKLAWQQKAVTEAHNRYLRSMREMTLLRLAERRTS